MKFNLKTLLLFAVLLVGCKNEGSTNESNATSNNNLKQVAQNTSKKLIFEIELSTSQPDEFRLFASNIFLNNNQFMNLSVSQKLNSNETSKKMRFEFPENIKPDFQLGFGLGTTIEKDIEIKQAVLYYSATRFEIFPDKLNDFFILNKFVEYNSETKILHTKKIDGRHNPMLFVRRKFLDSLQNID